MRVDVPIEFNWFYNVESIHRNVYHGVLGHEPYITFYITNLQALCPSLVDPNNIHPNSTCSNLANLDIIGLNITDPTIPNINIPDPNDIVVRNNTIEELNLSIDYNNASERSELVRRILEIKSVNIDNNERARVALSALQEGNVLAENIINTTLDKIFRRNIALIDYYSVIIEWIDEINRRNRIISYINAMVTTFANNMIIETHIVFEPHIAIEPYTIRGEFENMINQYNFNRYNFNRYNFNQANVNQIDINQANVNQIDINQANVNQIDINQANVNQANVNQIDINQANVNQANVNQANVNQANVNQIDRATPEVLSDQKGNPDSVMPLIGATLVLSRFVLLATIRLVA